MFGKPSIVSVVDPAAMIAALFIVQWLQGAVGGLSIPLLGRGVKSLIHSPVVAASRPPTPCEDFNYKSSWKVTGCNPHRFCFITC